MENAALGAAIKNARRRRAWLVFEDESGISQHPVVRRTWAPRGQTPILTHTGGNWKRLSVAGAEVSDLAGLYRRVWSLGAAGVEIPVSIYRDGKTMDVRIKTTDRSRHLKAPKLH